VVDPTRLRLGCLQEYEVNWRRGCESQGDRQKQEAVSGGNEKRMQQQQQQQQHPSWFANSYPSPVIYIDQNC